MKEERLSIVGVFAHPADMAAEAGGTLALHAERGDDVRVIILTHGGRLHPNIYIEEARKGEAERNENVADAGRETILGIKRAEMLRSAEILGIGEVVMLDYEDVMVAVDRDTVTRVADRLSSIRPHLIVTHHPGFGPGIGSDHCLAGQIACAASSVAAKNLSNLDDKPPHFVKQVYFCSNGVSSRSSTAPGGGPINDLYVDITPVVEKKIRAMDQFVSQGYEGDYARKCVAGHNGHWGSIAGVTFAEAFMRSHAEIHPYLPLPTIQKTRDEITAHRSYSRKANVWTLPVEPSPTSRFLSRNA